MNDFTVNMEQRELLGFHLKRRRIVKEMTIGEISNKTGVDKRYLKALEKGKISFINPIVLMKLGEALEMHYMLLYMLIGYVDTLDCAKLLSASSYSYFSFSDDELKENYN